ncbi:MAG: restriction endonuclease subunit S [Thermodesulfobacteriota bacterium]|nr:restriction endonuclease subunit S [Thermodesulfobacteriota bacterium]
MKGWEEDIFNNFIKLNRGFDLPEKDIIEGTYPVVASTSIKTYHKYYKVNPPAVVTGRSGSLGTVQYINKKCWPLNTSLYVKDFKGNYPKYVFYFLKTFHLENFNSGAGVPTLNQNHLHKLKIRIPPLPIQRKIAAVLSAYDDLIENNNHRIALLEKMAEELYREWFVRLRFPGHDSVGNRHACSLHKGVPEGWEIRTVENTFKFLGGGTPSTTASGYWHDGEINWYSPTDLTAANALFSFQSRIRITELGLRESSARLFPPYSIMMTSRATIGQISINTTPACTNQGFITCIPNEKVSLFFLYHWLKLNKDNFIQLSNGATFLELTKGKFKNIKILVPSAQIMGSFSDKQKPLFNSIENLLKQNDLLTTSRDRLLSRLMSGKIDLENLDIRFPASMKEEEVTAHA